MPAFDVITMGRSGLDLYAEQVGAPFEEIKSFAAYVGGTPANIAVGCRRLGLRTSILTAASEDPVGDFILRFLRDEGIDTESVPRKKGTKSGLVVLGIMPPDRFPRVHYRDNCADVQLTIDDVLAAPVSTSRALVVVGTNLSRSPGREATQFAVEVAVRSDVRVVLDLDYRPDLWHDERAYAPAIRTLLPMCHTIIGTQEEILAATGEAGVDVHPSKNPHPEQSVNAAIDSLLEAGPDVLVEKRGSSGSRVHLKSGERIDAPGFPVEVQNTLGAGDAFAAGYLYGYLKDWGWYRSARLGNACGAIVVTRHACSASCPGLSEVEEFIASQGGI